MVRSSSHGDELCQEWLVSSSLSDDGTVHLGPCISRRLPVHLRSVSPGEKRENRHLQMGPETTFRPMRTAWCSKKWL
jgi:hypothetical protein